MITTNNYLPSLTTSKYNELLSITNFSGEVALGDHLGGFDSNLKNKLLDHISTYIDQEIIILVDQIFNNQVQSNYPKLKFKLNFPQWLYTPFEKYNIHPKIQYQNFICSFNGTDHVGRQLLVAILDRFEFFNPAYSSKNFICNFDNISGHVEQYTAAQASFYNKFFVSKNSNNFLQTEYSFGHIRFDHAINIHKLESQLTKSFLHIVSETMATSYAPFVSEKFLYSIVTRGLFLAYAQPGWHNHLERYYGFKKYVNLFDYRFDTIENPVERLVEMITMISKFSKLSPGDWHDLYLLEQDTVEYNYDHYFSRRYLEQLKKYEN